MTWRFRKRKKLFPGVTLNITNKSLGVTVGNRGGRISFNILNCGDFCIDMDAQACYLRCLDLTGRDVHGLDRDKDGGACEWSW